ncbi:MAG: transketolase [Bacilli bacterium]|nr:transketolase [Bacilli bacterium]
MAKKNNVFTEKDQQAIAVLRSLIIDTINKANSGHPGMALDAAPIEYVLFKNHLVANPKNPNWINRDRFILSAGHTCALHYSLLHLAGYDISLGDLKQFRQLNSLTPGHPEVGLTPGIDASSGPLGQGVAQAVGFAMAERFVRSSYKEGEKLMSHKTYCLCGDGCLQEGLSQEAISLAGFHKLSNLVLFYDANTSTLDGPTSQSFNEDVALRFKASGWNVLDIEDGNNLDAIDEAISLAKEEKEKPTLIIVHTLIGYGSSKQGSHETHGKPLGKEDGEIAKSFYGYGGHEEFSIPPFVYELFKETFAKRGEEMNKEYDLAVDEYKKSYPEEYARFIKAFNRDYAKEAEEITLEFGSEASRNTSGKIVAKLPSIIPSSLGGSADVAASVMTAIPGDPSFSKENPSAHNINFGIREFAMAAIQNGMLLHGGVLTYIGSFLVFSDYMKNAIRMAALQHLPAIYLFSHDSIAVGEDGPTHEPIEQLVALRTIPDLVTFRPCDSKETLYAWKEAIKSKSTPHAIILSRQKLPLLESTNEEGFKHGGYIVYSGNKPAEIELIASGSEVSTAIEAAKKLEGEGLGVIVASFPSLEVFEKQTEEYKSSVLCLDRSKIYAFEMSHGAMWYRYAEHVKSIDRFGLSAPMKDVISALKFTSDDFVAFIKENIR